ncbi:WD40 repeat-like protein [Trametes maxima]|nr:WD40 repeat-like protein [Trametes maxima]
MAHAEVVYTAASTNRYFQAASISPKGLVAFGSARFIALWDSEDTLDRGVRETLPGHEGVVSCVNFSSDDTFVSADDKGVVRLWKKKGSQWSSCAIQQAHKSGIASIAVYGKYVVTGASDSTVKVWSVSVSEIDAFHEVQTVQIRKGFPLSLALTSLPGTEALLLAIGSTDRNIHLWISSEETFVQAAVLSGHEDWVKSLAFRPPQKDGDHLILASGSQDANIRLWNIEPFEKPTFVSSGGSSSEVTDELLDAFEASLVNLEDTDDGGRQISLKRHILTVKSPQQSSQLFSITFDALLVGHEAGVTSLSWRPHSSPTDLPTLLSTSTDSSLILWSPSTVLTSSTDGTTLWINRQRFGDIGGQRLGGFVGGMWARGGSDAMSWGWNGGWRRWRCDPPEDDRETTLEEWTEVGAITGHRAPVRSIAWSSRGEYLISSSLDQTTRIHGAIPTESPDGSSVPAWHEIARPQVHGYDLIGAAFLDPLRFVSIADEKVTRVFEAPREFLEVVNNLGVASIDSEEENRPRAAAVPPLGLSNKALTDASAVAQVGDVNDTRTLRRPFEGELAAVTLWPEIEKVFGHGYESIALAVSNNKEYIATACKATSAEHAVVRVYETQTWQSVGQPLAGHNLTVTRIAFSPDDSLILSVSRDRTWRLFERSEEDGYVPIAADKSHGRIIWDCAWAPEGDIFATASRDKTVKIWRRQAEPDKWTAIATIQAKAAATAVAFAPPSLDEQSITLAVGLESGEIHLYASPRDDPSDWSCKLTLDTHLAHVDHIHRLAWRPTGDHTVQQLASCGEDELAETPRTAHAHGLTQLNRGGKVEYVLRNCVREECDQWLRTQSPPRGQT